MIPGLTSALVAFGVLAIAIVAALPWDLPAGYRLAMPFLPYVLIHIVAERRAAVMPDWLVFLAGLVTDVLGQGPLGYWTLVYLSGFTIMRAATAFRENGPLGSIALFAVVLLAMASTAFVVISLYRFQIANFLGLLLAILPAFLVHLLLVFIIPARHEKPQRGNDRLERGSTVT